MKVDDGKTEVMVQRLGRLPGTWPTGWSLNPEQEVNPFLYCLIQSLPTPSPQKEKH